MTRRKHLDQRRAVNRQIAERDAANRCDYCRIALGGADVSSPWQQVLNGIVVGRFCSRQCAEAWDERKTLEASR